jgi:hypothetical protein
MDQRSVKREGGEETGEEEDERRDEEPRRRRAGDVLSVSLFFARACAADDESQVDGLPGQRLYAGFNGARSSPFFVCSACPGATMARSPPAADSDLGRRRRATRPSAGEGGGRRRKSSRGGGTARRGGSGSGIVRVGERERSGGRE